MGRSRETSARKEANLHEALLCYLARGRIRKALRALKTSLSEEKEACLLPLLHCDSLSRLLFHPEAEAEDRLRFRVFLYLTSILRGLAEEDAAGRGPPLPVGGARDELFNCWLSLIGALLFVPQARARVGREAKEVFALRWAALEVANDGSATAVTLDQG